MSSNGQVILIYDMFVSAASLSLFMSTAINSAQMVHSKILDPVELQIRVTSASRQPTGHCTDENQLPGQVLQGTDMNSQPFSIKALTASQTFTSLQTEGDGGRCPS